MSPFFKALLVVPFCLLWFSIVSVGCLLLIFPSMFVSAFGSDVRMLEGFVDLMDDIFNLFKEL